MLTKSARTVTLVLDEDEARQVIAGNAEMISSLQYALQKEIDLGGVAIHPTFAPGVGVRGRGEPLLNKDFADIPGADGPEMEIEVG